MLINDIYTMAAALISEDPEGEDNGDLIRRAPALASLIVNELAPLDAAYNDGRTQYPRTFSSLNDRFPLCDGLADVCAYKLAYLFSADENTTLYTALKNEYESAKRAFIESLPAAVTPVKNRYAG